MEFADEYHTICTSEAVQNLYHEIRLRTTSFVGPTPTIVDGRPLPPDYQPTGLDVCSGRGKTNWRHNGNVHFRNLIQTVVQHYIDAPTRNDKSAIVVKIVEDMRSFGCQFLKQNRQGLWIDIGCVPLEFLPVLLLCGVLPVQRTQEKTKSVLYVTVPRNSAALFATVLLFLIVIGAKKCFVTTASHTIHGAMYVCICINISISSYPPKQGQSSS
jgi:hypothetical protein